MVEDLMYPHEDVRDLLGMRTRGAWLILACYLAAMIAVTAATLTYVTTAWPAVLAVVVVIAATIALVAVPGDPLPASATVALTAAGPVACALFLSVTPPVIESSLQLWIHGAGTAIYCFMNVRGRRVAPWLGLVGMVAVFAVWATDTEYGAAYGVSVVAIDAAPLTMAALLSFTLRPTAKVVFSLRRQTTERIAELSSDAAVSDERRRQLRHLDSLVRPLLERISEGTELTASERSECALLEAHLRDRLRAPVLITLELDDAAYRARTRGVDVVFIDDLSPHDLDDRLADILYATASTALHTASRGQVCVRVLPTGRTTVASILARNDAGTFLQEIDQDGKIHVT